MKKALLIIATMAACVSGFILGRAAQPLFGGNLAVVNNTTSNLVSQSIGRLSFSPGTSYIQHVGLANTNDQLYTWQISLDQTNYFTIGTWRPTATNSGTESAIPVLSNATYYGRITLTTTNSTQGGGSFQFQ
jgi:hypothetical protein